MMRALIRCVTALALAAAILLCAAASPVQAREDRVLHVYTWADYFDSEVVNDFQKKYNCRVVIDYFDSNELMFKALLLDSTGYDVITPSSYMAAAMHRRGMLLDLDSALIPNLQHLDPKAASIGADPGMKYSVPYTRSVTGVGYSLGQVPERLVGSWKIFADPGLANRMTLLNDMRECMGAALKALGHSINTTDEGEIAEAGNLIRTWMKNAALLTAEESKAGLIDGKFLVAQAYNGDVALGMSENPDLGFFVPEEGSSLDSDDFVISGDSPYPDLAHAFINHMLDPEMARRNMESIYYYMPNPPALEQLGPELVHNPAFRLSSDVIARCETIKDLGEDTVKYEAVWNRILAEQ